METIFRLNPLLEVLRKSPRRITKLLIQNDRRSTKAAESIHLARKAGIPVLFVPRQKLDRVCSGHQGIVAFLSLQEFFSLEEILPSTTPPFVVLLDEIEDPQNLGAIIRAAEGAGVDGIVIPERRSAGVTETVFSVSAGAAAHVRIARVKNLARTMEDLKTRGMWLVGAEGGGNSYWYDFDYTRPLGLVFGSEGKGLRPLVKSRCDILLSVPLFGHLNSLNVASAASIFLFEVVRQRMSKTRAHE